MSAHYADNSPVLRFCWENWNKRGLTWQQACKEAALVMHLAVKLEDVRARATKQAKLERRAKRAKGSRPA